MSGLSNVRGDLESIEISRLTVGDEHLGMDAVVSLKSEEERAGFGPSLAHMREFLARDENYLIVARAGIKPVGFLVAYSMLQVARDASMVYLYEIDVTPGYQRRGIGTRMIELLKSLCKSTDVSEMWVGTSNHNIAAKGLYTRTGAILEDDDNSEFIYEEDNFTI